MKPIDKILKQYAEFVDYWTDGNATAEQKDYNAQEAKADIKELFMAQLQPIKKIDINLYRRLRQRVSDL